MASSLLLRINTAFLKLEHSFALIFGFRRQFPDGLCMAQIENEPTNPQSFSLKEVIQDGILWAVPKHRRSLEKRWKRKYGSPQYTMKILLPKTNIRVCNSCGDHHEIGVLCPTCYMKVMEETKQMQSAIQEKLGLQPVEKEILVLYENEKNGLDGNVEGLQIVEMKKPRPSWFSKNLLQQTTAQPDNDTKDVKPSGLG